VNLHDTDPIYVPIAGLLSSALPKLTATAFGVWMLEIARSVGSVYADLLIVDGGIVAAIGLLIALDGVTGVIAARRAGIALRSRVARRTGYKVLEYSALAYASVALANAFAGSTLAPLVALVDDATLLYIATTEAWSIGENVLGSGGVSRALAWLRSLRDGDPPAAPPGLPA
jgi:hypothetical protein